jgi:integrase/recombinase XerD
LFYSCGLRRSEAEALNLRDIHFKSCLLYVREGKGAKRRSVPLTKKVSDDLLYFFSIERKDIKTDTQAFIVNRLGRRMSGSGYNIIFKELLAKSKISDLKPETSLHHLRHSIATHLLESGLSIEYVRDFLGHRHLESTQVYTKYFSFQLKK